MRCTDAASCEKQPVDPARDQHSVRDIVRLRPLRHADLVFIANGRAVITELKLERSADEALQQIKERGYADKYLGKYDEVWLLGVSIAKENLQVSWKAMRL